MQICYSICPKTVSNVPAMACEELCPAEDKLDKVELSSIFIDWPPRGGAAAAGGRGGGRPRDAGHRLQQPPPGSLRCG